MSSFYGTTSQGRLSSNSLQESRHIKEKEDLDKMATGDGTCSGGRKLYFPAKDSPTRDQVISEWKDFINIVDHSLTSLGNSLDMMHTAVLKVAEISGDRSMQDEHDKKLGETYSFADLLMCIERTVLHDGHFAMSTVKDFIQTVINAVTQISGMPVEEFEQLLLGTHRNKYKEDDNFQGTEETKMATLKRKNFDLKEEEKRLQILVSALTERNNELLTENDNLRDKTKKLEECNENLEVENKKCVRQIANFEEEVEKLKAKFKDSGLLEWSIAVLEKQKNDLIKDFRILQEQHKENVNSQTSAKDIAKKECQKEIDDLSSEVDLFSNRYKEANEANERLKKDVEDKKKDIEDKNSLIEFYKTEVKEKEKEIENNKAEISQLLTQYSVIYSESDFEKRNNRKQNEKNTETIKTLNFQIEEYRRKDTTNKNMQKEYDELQKRHDALNTELQTNVCEVHNFKTQVEQLKIFEIKSTELESQLNTLKKENEDLLKAKDLLHKNLQLERKSHQKSLKENGDLNKKVGELFTEKDSLQRELEIAAETKHRLMEENKLHLVEISELRNELEMYKSKKLIQVQLYYQRRGELITTVEEELTRILKRRIEATGKTEIVFVKCAHTSDVNPEIPLLLLCICASRIGTDAANTIQGLQLSSKMSLLIFHHKDIHALPSQASYQVLTGGEFKTMSGIFDLAFLSGKGIYSCPLNDNSIDKIVTFINTESLPDMLMDCPDKLSR